MKKIKCSKRKVLMGVGLLCIISLCVVLFSLLNTDDNKGTTSEEIETVKEQEIDKDKITPTDTIDQSEVINDTDNKTESDNEADSSENLTADSKTNAIDNSKTLRNTYGELMEYVGNCVSLKQLQDEKTLEHIKSQYNSITLENEMKPDALLGAQPRLSTLDKAKGKGVYIPTEYEEGFIPLLNFDTIDQVLKICYDNKLAVRAHTLLWHNQTPSWFFKKGYDDRNEFVDQKQMNIRLEYYIKNVMNHVYESNYGSVVYAWDVANEYLHASESSGWGQIYGPSKPKSDLLKYAFELAYECLEENKMTEKVSLFYNDYNTFEEVDDIKQLIEYINQDKKLCNGVGMQSHVDTNYPAINTYTKALQAFVDAGYEVQITEMDIKNTDEKAQADYAYELFSNIIDIKQAGGNITGITFWGLYDEISWIRATAPLLFSSFGEPKESYIKVIDAYTDKVK